MNSRVNPSSTLRQQHTPTLWRNSSRNSIRGELHLVRWEMLHHQSCQITIFTQREQIFLVEGVDVPLRVVVNDTIRDDDRPTLVRRSDTIQRETTGQTGDRAEQTFESFSKMMGDVIFVNLNHRPP